MVNDLLCNEAMLILMKKIIYSPPVPMKPGLETQALPRRENAEELFLYCFR